MKKVIILSAILLGGFCAEAQMNTSLPESISTRDLGLRYKSEARKLNRTGFVLLTTGALVYALGSSMFNKDWNSTPGLVLGFAGLLMVPASIPCFIIAGSRNRQAKILLQREKTSPGVNKNNNSLTSVGLSFSF